MIHRRSAHIASAVTLTGYDQAATATQSLDIGDDTGSGSGWNVTLSSTPFTSSAHTLANADFTALSPPAPTCDAGATCTSASWSGSVAYAYMLPGTTATKLLSASPNT